MPAMLKLYLSERYLRAFEFAFQKHRRQLRKGSGVPYLSHVMSVSALVMEHGGGEDEAIAALLHDVVEDCGVSLDEIRVLFGERVADIVDGCTKAKVDWKTVPADKVWETMREGHLRYFDHLRTTFDSIRLVSACDKLHNSRDIVKDLEAGRDIFARMKGGPAGTLWYYEKLAELFINFGPVRLGRELSDMTIRMAKFVPPDDRLMLADGLTSFKSLKDQV